MYLMHNKFNKLYFLQKSKDSYKLKSKQNINNSEFEMTKKKNNPKLKKFGFFFLFPKFFI
jgi:hypothetical protein